MRSSVAHFLIVALVPEAEPLVARLRDQFDPAARRGLGAHITLRHAALAATGIDAALIDSVSAVAAGSAPFEFALTGVARFPGTLYLAVEPAAAFAELNRRLEEQIFAGSANARTEKQLVPHVSVIRRGSGADLTGQEVSDVERALVEQLARHGPIRCMCRELVLFENSTGPWRPVRTFALNGCTDGPSPEPS